MGGAGASKDILIQNNTLEYLKLGASEALVINGDVSDWQVIGNTVRYANNIGIDAIGFEAYVYSN
ncbi:MAG: hypothetical protein R2865_00550 [Deinococcales bacterium]